MATRTNKYEYGEKIIQVRNVDKNFEVANEYVKVIHNIDFDVYEGEFIMICGPSGSGKSTLLNMIAGWEEPTYGDVLIEGNDIFALQEDNRIQLLKGIVSMVNQQPHWINSLNTLENIEIPYLLAGNTKKEATERAEKLLSFLGFQDSSAHKPLDLSGGQQQRISLLRGLINNPKIIIADEPTGNLDSVSSGLLMDFLMKVHLHLNRTIIMATHNMELLKYSTRVIRIVDGRIDKITEIQKKFKSVQAKGDILDLENSKLLIPNLNIKSDKR